MAFAGSAPSPGRIVGIGFVVLLHIALVYVLVTGLAFRAARHVSVPVVTRIIAPTPPPQVAPPPPAPPVFQPPPPAFVPPPEVHIAAPPAPNSTAITAVTPVKPPAAAPPHAPVSVLPHIDTARSRAPVYPRLSRERGEQGTVILQVLVDAKGRAIQAKLVTSSGVARLDQAALAAARNNYRFVPGTLDGTPQPMWYTFKFTWKLQ